MARWSHRAALLAVEEIEEAVKMRARHVLEAERHEHASELLFGDATRAVFIGDIHQIDDAHLAVVEHVVDLRRGVSGGGGEGERRRR